MKRISQTIFLLFLCAVGYARPASALLDNAEEFYLQNGMQVVVIPNHRAPLIFHGVMYKAGSVNDPIGRGGTAHLLEHLMFRGTQKIKSGDFNRLIEENGGISNAGTSYDYTVYYQLLDVKSLELAMYLEADRMTGLKINETDFQKERDIVFQERQQRLNKGRDKQFFEKFNQLIWRGSPYGRSIGGTNQEIRALTSEDVKTFYQNHYAPNNAVLILSGDIDVKTAKELAEKYYGHIPPRAVETVKIPEPESDNGARLRLVAHQSVDVSSIMAYYMMPEFAGNDTSQYAWLLYSDYLGSGSNSVFYKIFVDKYHLTSSFDVGYSFLSRQGRHFYFYGLFNDAKVQPKMEKAFGEALRTAARDISEDKLSELKEKRIAALVYCSDNPHETGMFLADWLGTGYALADLKHFEDYINGVDIRRIKEIADIMPEIEPEWAILLPRGGSDEK